MTRARKSAKRKSRARKPDRLPVWVVLRAGLPVAVCFTESDARFHVNTTPVVLVGGRPSPLRVARGRLQIFPLRFRPGRPIEAEFVVTYRHQPAGAHNPQEFF